MRLSCEARQVLCFRPTGRGFFRLPAQWTRAGDTLSTSRQPQRHAGVTQQEGNHPQPFFSDFVSNLDHRTTVPGETEKSCCNESHFLIQALKLPVSACHTRFSWHSGGKEPVNGAGFRRRISRPSVCRGDSPAAPARLGPQREPPSRSTRRPGSSMQEAGHSRRGTPASDRSRRAQRRHDRPTGDPGGRPTNGRPPLLRLCILRAGQCKALASRSSPTLPRSMPRLWKARRSSSPPSARACA